MDICVCILDICVCRGAAQFTGAASARGGRGAELQSKVKHGGNLFRLEPGNCHQLSIPHVMTAYSKWAANQSTAKKAPFWVFWRSSRKLQEPTPPYGDVLGATQHGMLRWLCTSKRRTSRPCHGVSCDTVRFILRAHLHIVWQAALSSERVCPSMRAHVCTHACIHICMHVRTGVRSQSHTNAHIFHT